MTTNTPPNFLTSRKDPTPPEIPPLRPTPIEAANALGAEMARLMAELDAARQDISFLRKHADLLEAKLEVAERDANHYRKKAEYFERFSMGIANNFNTIRMLIDETQRRVDAAANRGETDTPPSQHTETPQEPATTSAVQAVESALAQIKNPS